MSDYISYGRGTFAGTQIEDRVAIDEHFSHASTEAGATAPAGSIDFTDGASHSLISQTIGGGTLGANGYIEVLIGGGIQGDGGGTSFMSLTAAMAASSTSASSGDLLDNVSTFEGKVLVQNLNSETSQGGLLSLVYGENGTGSLGPSMVAITKTVDTTTDWTFGVSVQKTSGTVPLAFISYVRINTQYVP